MRRQQTDGEPSIRTNGRAEWTPIDLRQTGGIGTRNRCASSDPGLESPELGSTHRSEQVVYVRPEQVVEIAVDGIQRSSRYPGKVALRFARVKGYRSDKNARDADTIDAVRALGTAT